MILEIKLAFIMIATSGAAAKRFTNVATSDHVLLCNHSSISSGWLQFLYPRIPPTEIFRSTVMFTKLKKRGVLVKCWRVGNFFRP